MFEHQITMHFDPYQVETLGLATKTIKDLTLYVRSDGSDNNTGLSESEALATIQEAVDRIPLFVEHTVVVDVGEGSFAGFVLTSKTLVERNYRYDTSYESILEEMAGSILIKGKLGNPLLGSGSTGGTASGGSAIQLEDSNQNWSENDLRGKLLKVNDGYRLIRSNTETKIDLANPFPFSVSGKDYEVFEQKTVLSGFCRDDRATIRVANITCTSSAYALQDLKVEAEPDGVGFAVVHTNGGRFKRIHVVDGQFGFVFQSVEKEMEATELYAEGAKISNIYFLKLGGSVHRVRLFAYGEGGDGGIIIDKCRVLQRVYLCADNSKGNGIVVSSTQACHIRYAFADNNAHNGIVLWVTSYCNFDYVYSRNNKGSGLRVMAGDWMDIDTGSLEGNGAYGIEIDENTGGDRMSNALVNMVGAVVIRNNKLDGIIGKHCSNLHMTNVKGANGGYGLVLMDGSKATISSQTAITGSSGDATIDEGANTLSWESDFANNGDKRSDPIGLCLISRRDIPRSRLETRAFRPKRLPIMA